MLVKGTGGGFLQKKHIYQWASREWTLREWTHISIWVFTWTRNSTGQTKQLHYITKVRVLHYITKVRFDLLRKLRSVEPGSAGERQENVSQAGIHSGEQCITLQCMRHWQHWGGPSVIDCVKELYHRSFLPTALNSRFKTFMVICRA